ncbi:MAG: hypothetical protein ABIG96_03960 [Candidatus Micrarchaeota archaeon]
MKIRKNHQTAIVLFALAAVIIAYVLMNPVSRLKTPGVVGEVHEHADFKAYLLGTAIDFTQEKYQSTDNKTLSPFIHLHDGNGNVLHKHATGATLGLFFKSLNMHFNSTCFIIDDGTPYCNSSQNTLKLYVNGKQNSEFGEYELNDLDKILISYGPSDDASIPSQLSSISDEACIYSETCPEKGKPPTDESDCTSSGNGCIPTA